ncbi:A designed zinc finger protein bound To Dna, partial [Periconia macrospinosa]
CDKVYTRKENLDAHYRSHTGERPWACQKCGKAFARKGEAHRHEKTCGVTDKDLYLCIHCGKGLTKPDGLKRHQ